MKDRPVTFLGAVHDGRLHLNTDFNRARFNHHLKSLEGQRIAVTVERQGRKRSLKQNNYYWVAVVPAIADFLRTHTPDATEEDAHELLKREFNPRHIKTAKGTFKIGASTTKMTTNDFTEYVMRIQQWADENGVFIPNPQEYDGPKFIDEV
jgi:hypothetical protein